MVARNVVVEMRCRSIVVAMNALWQTRNEWYADAAATSNVLCIRNWQTTL